jgi:hypothetical protein
MDTIFKKSTIQAVCKRLIEVNGCNRSLTESDIKFIFEVVCGLSPTKIGIERLHEILDSADELYYAESL